MSSNPLLSEAVVTAIQNSVKTDTILVDDQTYLTRQVFDPPSEALPRTLQLNTLKGLADYIKSDLDTLVGKRAIQIVSEERVEFFGATFGRHQQRYTHAAVSLKAIFGENSFRFGQWYELEDFNIKLRTLFQDTNEQAELIRLLGNIKEERVRTTEDDGISQTVIARVGVASVTEVRVPSPVTLRPWRTFREILDQPASPFIIRLRPGDEDELPTVALFEADGGKWKLDAIDRIANFLVAQDLRVTIFA